jgi:hypothetical protein
MGLRVLTTEPVLVYAFVLSCFMPLVFASAIVGAILWYRRKEKTASVDVRTLANPGPRWSERAPSGAEASEGIQPAQEGVVERPAGEPDPEA